MGCGCILWCLFWRFRSFSTYANECLLSTTNQNNFQLQQNMYIYIFLQILEVFRAGYTWRRCIQRVARRPPSSRYGDEWGMVQMTLRHTNEIIPPNLGVAFQEAPKEKHIPSGFPNGNVETSSSANRRYPHETPSFLKGHSLKPRFLFESLASRDLSRQ